MSHGCVNLPLDVAQFVFDNSPIGTRVYIHY
jgi:lipoprotein-anchoring transpeptidase ErfK/SrfK